MGYDEFMKHEGTLHDVQFWYRHALFPPAVLIIVVKLVLVEWMGLLAFTPPMTAAYLTTLVLSTVFQIWCLVQYLQAIRFIRWVERNHHKLVIK